MKRYLQNILVVVIVVLIIGLVVYFASEKTGIENNEKTVVQKSQKCQNLPDLPDGAEKLVTKVIDGDTFVIEGGYSVRILGVDAEERGYPCYQPAKEFLEKWILNKKVKLEKGIEDKDQWCRYLRYAFIDGQNISLELVRNGLAIAYFSQEGGKYQREIIEAEKKAIENKVGCKWSREIAKEAKKYQWQRLTTENLGYDVVDACLAGQYLGRELIVEGKVVDTYYHQKSGTVFLNFEKPYPNQCFTAVIFQSNLPQFPSKPENYYLNKRVRIFGEVKEYQGRPEIILESPQQIEVGEEK